MKRQDIEKLLGGYAAGNLTESERSALFQAALDDQALFDALVKEQPLQELLAEPSVRRDLIGVLTQEPASLANRIRGWFGKPSAWALAGGAAAVAAIAVMLIQFGVGEYEVRQGRAGLIARRESVRIAESQVSATPSREQARQAPRPDSAAGAAGPSAGVSNSDTAKASGTRKEESDAAGTPQENAVRERPRREADETTARPEALPPVESLEESKRRGASAPAFTDRQTVAAVPLPAAPPAMAEAAPTSAPASERLAAALPAPPAPPEPLAAAAPPPPPGDAAAKSRPPASLQSVVVDPGGVPASARELFYSGVPSAAPAALSLRRRQTESDSLDRAGKPGTPGLRARAASPANAPRTMAPRGPLGLRTAILRSDPAGEYRETPAATVFSSGDSLRIAVEPNEEGYLYAFERDPGGGWTPIYPPEFNDQATARAGRRTTFLLPPGTPLRFSPGEREKRFLVVLARRPLFADGAAGNVNRILTETRRAGLLLENASDAERGGRRESAVYTVNASADDEAKVVKEIVIRVK